MKCMIVSTSYMLATTELIIALGKQEMRGFIVEATNGRAQLYLQDVRLLDRDVPKIPRV